jgi:hypothetical protein
MIRKVNIRIRYDRWSSVAALLGVAVLVAAFLSYLLWGQTQVVAGMEVSRPAPASKTARTAATGGVRQYYLTQSIAFDGNEAAGACAVGYHMASVWELLDTSNLQYNTVLGRTQADSGYGPPSGWEGWVRTGHGNSTSGPAGQPNCNGWSSDSSGHFGTSVYLTYDWEADQDLSTWITGTWTCNTTMPVWCVADQDSGTSVGAAGVRQYYLTADSNYIGSQASTACAAGYHMASLWEILDPSNLRYNTSLGDSRADSGMGPPSDSYGWIRTGYSSDDGSDPAHGPGRPNCDTWSSSGAANYGTTLNLPSEWTDADQQDVSVWDAGWRQCSEGASVWCVADDVDTIGTCLIPQPIVSCGQQISGDTTGHPSRHDSYDCSTWDESGPEMIYSLELPAALAPYTVTATLSDLSVDLDVFILPGGGCYQGHCLTYDNLSASASDLSGGTYYIAVDGYVGAAGSYTLSVDCELRKVFVPLVLRNFQ